MLLYVVWAGDATLAIATLTPARTSTTALAAAPRSSPLQRESEPLFVTLITRTVRTVSFLVGKLKERLPFKLPAARAFSLAHLTNVKTQRATRVVR